MRLCCYWFPARANFEINTPSPHGDCHSNFDIWSRKVSFKSRQNESETPEPVFNKKAGYWRSRIKLTSGGESLGNEDVNFALKGKILDLANGDGPVEMIEHQEI